MRILIVFVLLLHGCAQLMNGELQPVKIKDPNKSIFSTTCGGAVETWASCNDKAMRTCSKGYAVIDKLEDSNGLRRELSFKCH
jgi:hypothetical protein